MEKLSDTNPITEAKPDRRILKTKRAIYEALVELMQKKKLNSITVTELAAAANINRKTFYTYYSTVNDVLDEGINELISSLKDLMYAMSEDYNMLSPQTLFAFLNTIMSDADIARDLFASDNGNMLFNRLQKALQETLLKELIDNDIKMNVPPEQYPLISSFVAGGMISAYYEWITNPNQTSLDDMARTLTTLIISGVHAFA
ncbi:MULTISPECIES: TetR/AcrR family transcriptional regulator [Clostridia]|jgi:AcrR family transcriptional regulator|uniref:TetR/AcrR family transcriptional regulator n=1 Tax=Clostridia TaxID=186801 RepID=UPI000E531AED|nr:MULTISPECIES: TetR/AcrR family transcriptional regulator [Clostridia]RGZ92126.1 TetR/AcrR family transcriptional regulator [Eubacterium sp. AM46-8]